jgi:hypothetical protein
MHLMASIWNAISRLGTEVEIVPGGYTGSVQILDKGINKSFKGYLREEFEWWMAINGSRHHPNRGVVAQWVKVAWDKVTLATIVNTLQSVGHNEYEEGNEEGSDASSVQADMVAQLSKSILEWKKILFCTRHKRGMVQITATVHGIWTKRSPYL